MPSDWRSSLKLSAHPCTCCKISNRHSFVRQEDRKCAAKAVSAGFFQTLLPGTGSVFCHPSQNQFSTATSLPPSLIIRTPKRTDLLKTLFVVAQHPKCGLGHFIVEVSVSQLDTHTPGMTPLDEWSASLRGRYLHSTQYSQETDIHAPGEIRTRNPSKPTAPDSCLRPRGHCDRLVINNNNKPLKSYGISFRAETNMKWRKLWGRVSYLLCELDWMKWLSWAHLEIICLLKSMAASRALAASVRFSLVRRVLMTLAPADGRYSASNGTRTTPSGLLLCFHASGESEMESTASCHTNGNGD
jgi:hypothetical protein